MAKYKVVFDPDGQVHIIADPESTSEAVVEKTAGLVDFDVHFTSGKTYTITAPEGTPDSTIQQAAWDKHNKYLAEVAASKNTATTQTSLATPQPHIDMKAEGTDMPVSAIPLFILAAIFFSPARYGRLVERLAVVIAFALAIVNILVMSKASLGIGDGSALFAVKIARMLPWAILIYGVVTAWVMYRKKNDKTIDYVFLWHACGVIVTAVVATMFNEVSIHWIFSGNPINSFGEFIDKQPLLYTLYHALVPAAVTVIYVKWLKNRDPSITIDQPYTHVKCPDCRELVLHDARKCKHCGCGLIPQ